MICTPGYITILKKLTPVALSVSLFLLLSTRSLLADSPPPDGSWVKVCQFDGSRGSGGGNFGQNFKLGTSYPQPGSQGWCCGGVATSNIQDLQLRNAIFLKVEVTGDHYRSVGSPGLETLDEDEDGTRICCLRNAMTVSGIGRPRPPQKSRPQNY
jgi:hypothetical protein